MGHSSLHGKRLNIAVRLLLTAAYFVLLAAILIAVDYALDKLPPGAAIILAVLFIVGYKLWPGSQPTPYLRKLLVALVVALLLAVVVAFLERLA